MRKLLLLSTAIVGAGSLAAAGDAFAQARGEPLRLTLGGYFQAYGVYLEQQDAAGQPGFNRRAFDLKREGEIFFNGETKFDNGLIVGVQVELEAESCTDQIDESYLYFAGTWGRVIIGSENSAAYLLAVGYPAIDNNFDGQDPNYRLFSGVAGDARGVGVAGAPLAAGATAGGSVLLQNNVGSGLSSIDQPVPIISADSEKFTYLSPRFAGFRFGVSYTPDNSEEASFGQQKAKGGSFAGQNLSNNIGEWGDILTAGVNYEGKFGPVSVLAGAGFEYGFLENDVALTAAQPFGVWKDRTSWQIGTTLGAYGFQVGGLYHVDDNGLKSGGTQKSWGAGASYTIGPLTVGGSYYKANRDRFGGATTAAAAGLGGATGAVTGAAGPQLTDENLERIVAGARYALAPGVDLRGTFQYYHYEAGSAATDNDAVGFVLGTVVSF